MAEHRYDPHEIEPRWQAVWADERTWEVSNEAAAEARDGRGARAAGAGAQPPASYVLEMLPYPSGEPHIGHLKCYSVGDAIAHFHRRLGARVLHPMGYDAFGLPAENHAIKTGVHPRDSTAESIASFQRQFRRWGISIDWSRELGHRRAVLLPLDAVDLPRAVPRAASPTARRRRSSGARKTRRCSPTSRWTPTAAASAAARSSRSSSSSSGSSASPTTPSGCWTTSTRSSGPSTSRPCSATGSGAARAPR